MLRRYLSDNGWKISEESALRDGRFLYTIMAVTYCPAESALTADQCYFSPALLRNPSEDVGAYYKWVLEGLRIATAHQDDPEKKQILAQLELLEQEAQKKGRHARISINWPQAVLQLSFPQEAPADVCVEEDANEGERYEAQS